MRQKLQENDKVESDLKSKVEIVAKEKDDIKKKLAIKEKDTFSGSKKEEDLL